MSTSRSAQATSSGNKRPKGDDDTAEQKAKKRQRIKEREKKDLRRVAAGREYDSRWTNKASAMSAWRESLPSTVGSSEQKLARTLDEVRAAASRPKLAEKQLELLSAIPGVHEMLLDVFNSPLFWSPAAYKDILQESSLTIAEELKKLAPIKKHKQALEADVQMIVEGDSAEAVDSGFVENLKVLGEDDQLAPDETEEDEDPLDAAAQFYIRRLLFPNHSALHKLLEGVKKGYPQYSGHVEILVAASAAEPDGQRWLSYGGYTIATSVIGRQKNDSQSDTKGSFLKAVLKSYKGSVQLLEVLPLRFTVGDGGHSSVMQGRNDERSRFFESLVIDCRGFLCLNTAPAGFSLEMAEGDEFLAGQTAVAEAEYTPKQMIDQFSWLKVKADGGKSSSAGGKQSSKK